MLKITNSNFTLTNITIAITVFMYFVQTNINHGGLGHLAMNMFVLYQFGNAIELYRGKQEFILAYFLAGLLTSNF